MDGISKSNQRRQNSLGLCCPSPGSLWLMGCPEVSRAVPKVLLPQDTCSALHSQSTHLTVALSPQTPACVGSVVPIILIGLSSRKRRSSWWSCGCCRCLSASACSWCALGQCPRPRSVSSGVVFSHEQCFVSPCLAPMALGYCSHTLALEIS